ncbi:hypothetical protein [Micromonospora sp. NPDC050276]|uniref:globin domain-containing protein n=1 Tax=Micromonospora sp. NPDC050276 TaxID=3364278 RepID=UPI0037921555
MAVAVWLAEVFGGPATYRMEHGGYLHMLGQHLGRTISEVQRRRWVNVMMDAADESAYPMTPSFAPPSRATSSGAPGWR